MSRLRSIQAFCGAAAFALSVTTALTLPACDGGGSGSPSQGKPTAAQLKAACNSVFDKLISCGGITAALATNYKTTECTDANATAFAACDQSAALLAQSQGCASLDCDQAPNCGLELLPSLQACLPDGGS